MRQGQQLPAVRWVFTAIAAGLLAACGGGGDSSAGGASAAISVAHVDPAASDVPEHAADASELPATTEPAARAGDAEPVATDDAPVDAAEAGPADDATDTAAPAARAVAAATGTAPAAWQTAVTQWRPLAESDISIAPGSALDFTSIMSRYASRDRSLCANWSMATLILPSTDAEMNALVAEVKRRGYNFVRMQSLDASLLTRARSTDREFDPVKLDKFFRLTAALSRAGVRYSVDIYSGDASYMKAATLNAIGWDKGKLRLLYDERFMDDWKGAVDTILGKTNPYLKKPLALDTRLRLVIGVNEGGIAFKGGFQRRFEPELAAPWNRWLADHYGSTAAWRAAWGSVATTTEDPSAGNVAMPGFDTRGDIRGQDFARFMNALETGLLKRMTDYLRAKGYTGFVSHMNVRNSWQEDFSREAGNAITYNAYHDHPSSYGLGATIRDESVFDGQFNYLRHAALHRYLDRPFYLTEGSQVFWNRWRREYALAGAYASHQGWEGLCSFGFTHDSLRYDPNTIWLTRRYVESFQMWGDPILIGVDRINNFLYRRGDVSEGTKPLGYVMRPKEAYAVPTLQPWNMNFGVFASKRAFLHQIGLLPESKFDASGNWIGGTKPYTWLSDPLRVREEYQPTPRKAYANVSLIDAQWYEAAARDREAGHLPASNKTNAPADIVQSDNAQLLWEMRERRARVITAKSELITWGDTPAIGRVLRVMPQSSPNSLVSIHTLDDKSIGSSSHMLLVHLSDARNTDMKFSDATEKTITDWGHLPVILRGSIVSARLIRGGAWKLYALDMRGNRIEERPITHPSTTTIEFTLDNTTGSQPVMYYELVKQ
ncbi:hypothetical protein [Derxia gummosa]|uniref:Uncharacterized protein n=1 Tax=Derxia gummosa DSM 723 TaxID=1121388 RepID=A0A8B6X1B3_9BURK|nr:hypothetical protein [Derxia gummosa]